MLSRANPDKKDELYGIIGFKRCRGFTFPQSLAAIKGTNPDAPLSQHVLEVTVKGASRRVLPVLLIKGELDPSKRQFLDTAFDEGIIEFKLVAVAETTGGCRALLEGDRPVLYDIGEVKGFFEQVGTNTDYVIHPEEILADNFWLLLTDAEVPEPDILEALGRVLGLTL